MQFTAAPHLKLDCRLFMLAQGWHVITWEPAHRAKKEKFKQLETCRLESARVVVRAHADVIYLGQSNCCIRWVVA
jgi:predicted peroxiredoxin